MKTTIQFFKLKKPLQILCGSLFAYLLSWPHLLQQWDVKTYLMSRVNPVLQRGRIVVLSHLNNSRHLVGDVFIGLVGFSFFLHQFFSMEPWNHSWYYTNWFYFLRTLRPWMMGLFATLAILYYWPKKNKSVYIPFTILHSLCWLGIIHFSLAYDFKSFHSYPHWSYWIIAGSVGVGFVLASDHLVYVFEHKIKGNHKRAIGIGEMDDSVDAETKIKLLKSVANEYRKLYTNY